MGSKERNSTRYKVDVMAVEIDIEMNAEEEETKMWNKYCVM